MIVPVSAWLIGFGLPMVAYGLFLLWMWKFY